jgi:hypothetical protein
MIPVDLAPGVLAPVGLAEPNLKPYPSNQYPSAAGAAKFVNVTAFLVFIDNFPVVGLIDSSK